MPGEMSLDEFSAYSQGTSVAPTGAEPPHMVPASLQAQRDTMSLEELHAEKAKFTDPADQEALDREIHARRATSSQKSMSLEEFGKVAKAPTETPPTPAKAPAPPPPQQSKMKTLALGALKEVATLGDMAIGAPGGVASSIGELAMQADMSAHGINRAGAEAAAAEFGSYIASRSQPKILSNMVAKLAKDSGEPASPGLIEQGMAKLEEWAGKGAEFIDTKSGQKWSKAEVMSEANFLMNIVGARGLGKLGPEIGGKAKPIEVETPIDPVDGNPTPQAFEALNSKLRPVDKPKIMSEKDMAKFNKRWGQYLAGRAEVESNRVAKEEVATKQSGSVDPKLLAGIAVGAGGVALAQAYPDKRDGLLGGVMALGMIGPMGAKEGMSLGSIVQRGSHNLTTLERLNQNHTEFPVKRIEEELRRPEVTKAEKDVFQAALADVPKDGKVSAADLTKRLNDATGNFNLTPKQTDDYADYGLAAINRGGMEPYAEHPQETIDRANSVLEDSTFRDRAEMAQPPGHSYDDYPHTREQAQSAIDMAKRELEDGTAALAQLKKGEQISATTTVWRAAQDTNVENHFQEPDYFAHSRSFDDAGVKHVVEIQSDLVQKHAKPVGGDLAYKDYQEKLQSYRALSKAMNGLISEGVSTKDPRFIDLSDRVGKADELRAAAWRKAREEQSTAHMAPLAPMWKDWHKRIAREELADSARKGQVVTRFADADTVAKVEGWPKNDPLEHTVNIRHTKLQIKLGEDELAAWEATGQHTTGAAGYYAQAKEQLAANKAKLAQLEKGEPPKYPPTYQGIYDRYKKETEPFLEKLGGKRVVDEHGHGWIEVPTHSLKGGKQAKMFGGATTDMMKTIAGAALGMAVVNQLDPDNPFVAAVMGALVGAGTLHIGTRGVKAAFGALMKADDRVRINNLTEAHQHRIERMEREVAKVAYAVTKLVPNRGRREAIHRAIDEGKVGTLKGDEAKAAALAQKFYADIAEEAQRLGVLETARANYSTHLWEDTAAAKGLLERKQAGMSANSRFAKERAYLTTEEGIAAGLKPKTTDIAEVMATYGHSMGRSMATARLVKDLHNAFTPAGAKLLMKAGRAPKEYVVVDSPALRAYRVHPDIAQSLKFATEAENPGALLSSMVALNTALKRTQVSFSLFHAKSLLEAALVAGHPILGTKVFAQSIAPRVFGVNKYIQMLREGGVGDAVDSALEGGLKISFERSEPGDLDMGGGFYHGMQNIQKAMDTVLPFGIGKAGVKGFVKANHAVDNFMWGRLHAGLKLEVWAAKKETLLENNAKAGHPISEKAASRMAAGYTNDVFGGLNWQRLAEGARTKWGRDIAFATNSRAGRMAQSVLEFAPDWTLSTMRAFYKAMPGFNKGNGLRGLIKPMNEVDLYRQQLIRFGLYYVTALNGINQAMSGHNIWENKDPTRIDFGDGRTMQAAKHSFEPFHAILNPGQTVVNKLGTLPKEAAEQALGVDYLNAKGRMPPMQGRLAHLGKTLSPISAQQFSEGGAAAGVAGFLGAPIYGKTKEQARQAAKEAREKRHKAMIAKYRKDHGLDQ